MFLTGELIRDIIINSMQLNISIKKGGRHPGECMKLPEIPEAAFLL